MPSVPERELSYGEIMENLRIVQRTAERKVRSSRAVRKQKKHKKIRLKNKNLVSDDIANQNHIRSIMREEL